MEDGKHTPTDGELYYRGYEIRQLIDGFTKEGRFGFEECTYLLLFGKLPDENELAKFKQVLNLAYDLPHNFIQDVIMKNPTKDIISNMTKSILALGSYDKSGDGYISGQRSSAVSYDNKCIPKTRCIFFPGIQTL